MSGFDIRRATVEGERQPQWLLFVPGERRPIVIPDGNLADLLRRIAEQGGTLEGISNAS